MKVKTKRGGRCGQEEHPALGRTEGMRRSREKERGQWQVSMRAHKKNPISTQWRVSHTWTLCMTNAHPTGNFPSKSTFSVIPVVPLVSLSFWLFFLFRHHSKQ